MSLPAPITLPCGCHLECQVIDGVNTLVVSACPDGESCRWIKYALDETALQGKPSTVIG